MSLKLHIFLLTSAGDKDKVVDIIAKHSDEKSKLQQLRDKFKEKNDQVKTSVLFKGINNLFWLLSFYLLSIN